MSVTLDIERFNSYLGELALDYQLYGPVLKKGKGAFSDTDVVGYGLFNHYEELVLNQKSYFSPKEVFYPIREVLFNFIRNRETKGNVVQDSITEVVPEINEKPVLLFLRPCDLNGIRRLDTIFLKNGDADYYYARRRELIKFVMIECTEGFDSCFCVSMGSNKATDYQAVLREDQEQIIWQIEDESLSRPALLGLNENDFEPQFIQENKVKVEVPPVSAITNDIFNHDIWTEYTQRCIACGRCNTSCITCSCFSMQDVQVENQPVTIQSTTTHSTTSQSATEATSGQSLIGKRQRVWASCHVDGYTDMAGGHSFRKQNGEKMRFKTLHKINDYHKRFGEHMCVGCGRCDDVCPEYISFSKCITKINQIIKEDV